MSRQEFNYICYIATFYSFLIIRSSHSKKSTASTRYDFEDMIPYIQPEVTLNPPDVIEAKAKQKGTVIFLHSMAMNGGLLRDYILKIKPTCAMQHIKFIFPTAARKPYTAGGGTPTNIWFDRENMEIDGKELLNINNRSCDALREMIKGEIRKGIPSKKIVIGGYSMGGAMAMHLAYRFLHHVAGVFTVCSFLNEDSIVYRVLKSKNNTDMPPLYSMAGQNDRLISWQYSNQTFTKLTQQYGIKGEFFLGLGHHQITLPMLDKLLNWISLRTGIP